jgi:hypothetical protein
MFFLIKKKKKLKAAPYLYQKNFTTLNFPYLYQK